VIFILDACALIAYINKEPEGPQVKALMERAGAGEIAIYMSVVNLAEVYYHCIKKDGEETADTIMHNAAELPIMVIDTIADAVCRETAYFKAHYPMSLADAFLCAAAKSLSAVIVTKDREIEVAEKPENLSVLWIH
jgi:predicted nucleic acid-binding protein